jgi:formate dehydrogenase subunit gamma
VVLLGDRRRLAADWRELERIDADDRRWLRGRPAAPGRFNAGQKLNALATAAFALLFAVSGLLIWLGERDHRFLVDGAGPLHVVLTWLSVGLLTGHVYLAVAHPRTRHALRGMTRGDVRLDWARAHHPRWVEAERPDPAPGEPPARA